MKMKPDFLNRINDIPLNFKFILIYVVCILLPIISINAVFLERLLNIVYEREENNYRISIDRSKADIVEILEGAVSVSHSITTDNTLNGLLDQSYENIVNYYDIYDSLLRNRLNLYTAAYNYITGISIYVDNTTIFSGGTYFRIDDYVKATSWYKKLESTPQSVLIYSYIGNTNSIPTRPIPYISIFRYMHGYPGQGIRDKILKVDINSEKLYSILRAEKDYIDLFIVDGDGNIICTADEKTGLRPEDGFSKYIPDKRSDDRFVFEEPLSRSLYLNGWKLVGTANRNLLSKAAGGTVSFVIILAAAFTLVSTLLIYIIVRSYNYRLKKLSRHMLELKDGQFDLIEMYEGRDEIGGLIRNFNKMADKIGVLINDVYKLEIQKKNLELERVRAELNFLQSQMNPHFLFNTLNAMVMDCSKNNYDAVAQVLNYLSKPLRWLINWKEDIVPIEEELTFTEMYLKIEKYRFRDRFFYNMEIDDEAKQFKIPKMTLQPLVENACKHGIHDIKGVGIVSLTIILADGHLRASVEDNGKGMDSGKLDEVICNINDKDDSGYNIGIRNVYRRLKLYYGDMITFNVESRENYGTCVSFTIPLEKLISGRQ